jgi:fibronectin type 3 domain-containing protein
MHCGMTRLWSLSCVALLLAGCADPPLSPDKERASLSAQGSLTAPTNLIATAVSTSRVDLAWRDKSSSETGFEVRRSTTGPTGTFAQLTRTGPNVTTYRNIGLTPSKRYCYKVRAFTTAGKQTTYSGFSSVACATTLGPPAAPSAANATPAASSEVALTWTDNSGNEIGFRVERGASVTGPWVIAAALGADQRFYRDDGQPSEQQVCYRVIAFNTLGDSPVSNTDCTTPPAGPTHVALTWSEDQSIDLTWEDNSASEDGYQLHRSAGSSSFNAVANLPPNTTSYRDVEVSLYVIYQYRVQAKKDGGSSDYSNVASTCTTGTEEICGNGTDDDCNGWIDSEDPVCGQLACDWGCPQGYLCGPEGLCVSHCSDGAPNGDEGDVDCGGSCAAKCDAGQRCNGNFDCASNFCVNLICHP